MKLFRFVAPAAMSFVMVGALAAQVPPQQPPASPRPEQTPAQPAAQARDAAEITIVGCLAQAKDAADAYTVTVAPPAAGVADAVRAASSATARPGTYKITGIAADQLKPHLNHQVEIKGRLNAAAAAQADPEAAQEFRGSAVKMLNATCPAAK